MTDFLMDVIATELEDAVGKENCSTRTIDKLTHSVDFFWLSRMWVDRGLRMPEGDFIVAIDGIPTSSVDNIYKLLIGKANVLTELTVNSKPSEEGAHNIVVKPIADEYPLEHYNWVQNNIKKVEEATNGRVGYIYIPDMNVDGLNEFARYFYPQLDKEALIIDDRANGGGNVSPMILERLLSFLIPLFATARTLSGGSAA